jgi:hypothetical protein
MSERTSPRALPSVVAALVGVAAVVYLTDRLIRSVDAAIARTSDISTQTVEQATNAVTRILEAVVRAVEPQDVVLDNAVQPDEQMTDGAVIDDPRDSTDEDWTDFPFDQIAGITDAPDLSGEQF